MTKKTQNPQVLRFVVYFSGIGSVFDHYIECHMKQYEIVSKRKIKARLTD